ncbi:MAG: CBS domain-containing protein [Bacteriovorax sp.]
MSLEKIMKEDVVMASAQTSIMEIAKLMKRNHVGAVVITKRNYQRRVEVPVGIITDRDIVMAFARDGVIDRDAPAEELMGHPLIVANLEEGVFDVIKRMKENGIKRLPVIDGGDQLCGIISYEDLLELVSDEMHAISEIGRLERENEQGDHYRINELRTFNTESVLPS